MKTRVFLVEVASREDDDMVIAALMGSSAGSVRIKSVRPFPPEILELDARISKLEREWDRFGHPFDYTGH